MKFTVFHPGVEPAAAVAPPAAAAQVPQAPLAGKLRLALLDNTKVNSIELMEAVARLLGQRIPIEVGRFRKRHAGESGGATITELMRWQPHLMLTGLGD